MRELESAIGPLWSKWGLGVWNLLLARNEIVAQKYRTWEMWRLVLGEKTGLLADPGRDWRNAPGLAPLHDGRGFRYYVVSELESITVTVSHMQNAVSLVHRHGRIDRYEIYQRRLTQHMRKVLQGMYPSLYKETGVPRTPLGRALKA